MGKKLCLLLFLLFSIVSVYSQSVQVFTLSPGADPNKPYLQFPIGATAGTKTNNQENPENAGAILGLQFGEINKYFISMFFNYSGAKKIKGVDQQFGSNILNPNTDGMSLTISGNKLWGKSNIKYGVSLRTGVSFTEWETTYENSVNNQNVQVTESHGGSIFYFVPSFIFCTKEYRYGEKPADNQPRSEMFQVGFEIGIGVRALMGELAQSSDFLENINVLNINKKTFLGLEGTFFLRINDLRPYCRITLYGKDIKGLSNFQAYIGVDVLTALFKTQIE